jgi:hypothetical protein
MRPKFFVNFMKNLLTKNNMGHIVYINILTAGKTARSIQMNKENFKMKNISSIKMGEVAKILAKTVGKGLGTGLKIGGVAALGLGAAGCESTPAVPTQVINGVIVDSYYGNSAVSGKGNYYVVDQDRNPETKEDQRLFYVYEGNISKYPEINVGAEIIFRWDAESARRGYSSVGDLVAIGGNSR